MGIETVIGMGIGIEIGTGIGMVMGMRIGQNNVHIMQEIMKLAICG